MLPGRAASAGVRASTEPGARCGRYPEAVTDGTPQSVGVQPWRRLGTETYQRRYELFFLAAPVFERYGFRAATMRALAHACHLSPAGLYHWFDSKEALATYLLRAPRVDWESTYVAPDVAPLVQLRQMIDLAIVNVRLYLLAIRLNEEIQGKRDDQAVARALRQGEAVFARYIHEVAAGMGRTKATALGRDLMATLVGSAVAGLDLEPEAAQRARLTALLRDRLVPRYVAPDAFDP